MKLVHQLLLLPLLGVVLMSIVVGVGWYQADSIAFAQNHRAMATQSVQKFLAARTEVLQSASNAYRTLAQFGVLNEAQQDQRIQTLDREFAQVGNTLNSVHNDVVAAKDVHMKFDMLSLLDSIKPIRSDAKAALKLAQSDIVAGTERMAKVESALVSLANTLTEHAGLSSAESDMATNHVLEAQSTAAILRWTTLVLFIVTMFSLGIIIARRISRPIVELSEMARRIAGGDLNQTITRTSKTELGNLQSNIGEMQSSIYELVTNVRTASQGIETTSQEVSAGNNDLSMRTEQAAGSLEETASGMEQLTDLVRSNADNARQANQFALGASDVAQRGGAVVDRVVSTMASITQSSERIQEIITVIDSIAFQTNILALNAAVEAARAGDQGRGFSVVAGEVRALASRSSEAAQQINELITASVTEVEDGSRLVGEAGSTMREVLSSISRVTDLMGEISAATNEESQQLSQINAAVTSLDQMTQQNAALVEESTAASLSLKAQAEQMTGTVSAFELSEHNPIGSGYADPAPSATPSAAPLFSQSPSVISKFTPRAPATKAAPAMGSAGAPAKANVPAPSKPSTAFSAPAQAPTKAPAPKADKKPISSPSPSTSASAAPSPSSSAADAGKVGSSTGENAASAKSTAPAPRPATAEPSTSAAVKAKVTPPKPAAPPTKPAAFKPAAPAPVAPPPKAPAVATAAATAPDDDWETF